MKVVYAIGVTLSGCIHDWPFFFQKQSQERSSSRTHSTIIKSKVTGVTLADSTHHLIGRWPLEAWQQRHTGNEVLTQKIAGKKLLRDDQFKERDLGSISLRGTSTKKRVCLSFRRSSTFPSFYWDFLKVIMVDRCLSISGSQHNVMASQSLGKRLAFKTCTSTNTHSHTHTHYVSVPNSPAEICL